MIFVHLVQPGPSGEEWTEKERKFLASKWHSMLQVGQLAAQVYNVCSLALYFSHLYSLLLLTSVSLMA